MLHSIIIGPDAQFGTNWTLGTLAELLFFYKRTELFLTEFAFASVARAVGLDNLRRALDADILRIHFSPYISGVERDSSDALRIVRIRNLGQDRQRGLRHADNELDPSFAIQLGMQKIGYSKEASRRLAREFGKKVVPFSFERDLIAGATYPGMAAREFESHSYISDSLIDLHTQFGVEWRMAEKPYFSLVYKKHSNVYFTVETNVDLNELNTAAAASPSLSGIGRLTPESFINLIGSIAANFYISQKFRSDIITNDLSTNLSINKFRSACTMHGGSRSQIERFQDTIFEGIRIENVIDEDRRNFRQFLDFMLSKDTMRFREWMHAHEPIDQNALTEYFKYTNRKNFWQGTGAKLFRIVTQIAASVAGDFIMPSGGYITGTAASAFDSFFIENLRMKWSPEYFVNGKLRRFLNSDPITSTNRHRAP